MKKREYASPVMTEISVELEQGFLKASIFEPEEQQKTGLEAESHQIGTEYEFSEQEWD